jgi:hypothetical protein
MFIELGIIGAGLVYYAVDAVKHLDEIMVKKQWNGLMENVQENL